MLSTNLNETDFFRSETIKHKKCVHASMSQMIRELDKRGTTHDDSKFSEEEAPYFIEYTPKLKASTYMSEEYKGFLKDLKPALDNHYKANRHHPEHFENGIHDMNLIDIMEMLADWHAATQRHDDGDIMKSIETNQERFGYDDNFKQMLISTVEYLGWRV